MIRRSAPLKRTALKPRLSRPNAKRPGVRRGPLRNRGYLDWLRERRCVACRQVSCAAARGVVYGYSSMIDPAHGPVNGRGSKGNYIHEYREDR